MVLTANGMRVALLTEDRFTSREVGLTHVPPHYIDNILADDQLLIDALAARGCVAERVSWTGALDGFDLAVFRTTWDYFDRLEAFRDWLANEDVPLLNRRELIEWNLDKRYLRDLERAGVGILPTTYLERGETAVLEDAFAEHDEVVIKPLVSGAARDTHRIHRRDLARGQSILDGLLTRKAMMIQPFAKEILAEGEITLVVIDGRPAHAVRKRGKPGDFRVQDDHGGTVHAHTPTEQERAFAIQAVATCPHAPLYARVDLVRYEGTLRVMELEVIEPELFLRFAPSTAEALASAITASR